MRDFPKRGEIYMVNFDRTVGSEIKKTRPAVIIQNDIANRHSPVTIVAAITSRKGERLYPTETPISSRASGLSKDSVVLLNQIRTIDKNRLAAQNVHSGKRIYSDDVGSFVAQRGKSFRVGD